MRGQEDEGDEGNGRKIEEPDDAPSNGVLFTDSTVYFTVNWAILMLFVTLKDIHESSIRMRRGG